MRRLTDIHGKKGFSAVGDVYINVPHGSIINANTNVTVDTRTEAQLLSGVWSALSLTDATGYQQQVNAVISTYVSAQEESYQTYWQFRNEQSNPSVYDPNFLVTLTPAQLAYYQSIGYTPAPTARCHQKRSPAGIEVNESRTQNLVKPYLLQLLQTKANTVGMVLRSGCYT